MRRLRVPSFHFLAKHLAFGCMRDLYRNRPFEIYFHCFRRQARDFELDFRFNLIISFAGERPFIVKELRIWAAWEDVPSVVAEASRVKGWLR